MHFTRTTSIIISKLERHWVKPLARFREGYCALDPHGLLNEIRVNFGSDIVAFVFRCFPLCSFLRIFTRPLIILQNAVSFVSKRLHQVLKTKHNFANVHERKRSCAECRGSYTISNQKFAYMNTFYFLLMPKTSYYHKPAKYVCFTSLCSCSVFVSYLFSFLDLCDWKLTKIVYRCRFWFKWEKVRILFIYFRSVSHFLLLSFSFVISFFLSRDMFEVRYEKAERNTIVRMNTCCANHSPSSVTIRPASHRNKK